MGWRLARSLTQLRQQVNALVPDRSKVADGTIGDVKHQTTVSDHNPDRYGVVRAFDLTHDPSAGMDAHEVAEHLLRTQDARLRYVISNGRIGSGPGGPSPGRWRPYAGSNRHDRHVHISVVRGAAADLEHPWDLPGAQSAGPPVVDARPPTPPDIETGDDVDRLPVLRQGATGQAVRNLQGLLVAAGRRVDVDGDFGPTTASVLRQWQAAAKAPGGADGVCGAGTWGRLLGLR